MATSDPVMLTGGAVLGLKEPQDEKWPLSVDAVPIPAFDSGVFITELINEKMLPKKFSGGLTDDERTAGQQNPETLLDKAQVPENRHQSLEEGTYRGTQLAMTKAYNLIEAKFSSFMDVANFEPTVPSPLSLEQKKGLFVFTNPASDGFPPHLNLAANAMANQFVAKDQSSSLNQLDIFNATRIAQLSTLLPSLIPNKFLADVASATSEADSWVHYGGMGTPDAGQRLADVEAYNRRELDKRWFQKDIFDLPNIGKLDDWYSDARFAQQHLTGTNPTTIEKAGGWVQVFIDAASETDPLEKAMKARISQRARESPESLYVQDYSYIRRAAGYADPKAPMSRTYTAQDNKQETKYNVASVCLFDLADNGVLEPLAIIIDWLGSAEDSVFIFNRCLNLSEQANDWPWRYAKTCVMTSDWIRHNIAVHLCRTHLVEEAVIVAAHRTLPPDHDVFQLLYPHWQKTLSLNAAARASLVPLVIAQLVGVDKDRLYAYLRDEYRTFDFRGSYVPEDLRRRGFPPERLGEPRFHNYAWARCIHSMWHKIRRYVAAVLALRYRGADADAQVRADEYVQEWSREMRRRPSSTSPEQQDGGDGGGGGADMASFPEIGTLDELVDAVTMCIHVASPQHTSVNYLQNYYQAFVVNKPPALYAAPPRNRAELRRYGEDDLVAALPMNRTHDWLLASHVPYLLSFKPGDKESLIIYAASKYHTYKYKRTTKETGIAQAAADFYLALAKSEDEFAKYGMDTDDHDKIVYNVLSPSWNAVSILI